MPGAPLWCLAAVAAASAAGCGPVGAGPDAGTAETGQDSAAPEASPSDSAPEAALDAPAPLDVLEAAVPDASEDALLADAPPPDACTTCGGACTELSSDARNCGACGTTCASSQGCASGTCVRVDPPTLLTPGSTSYVYTRRPTFRFRAGLGATGGRVEVCLERSCSTVVARMTASAALGTFSAAPTAELAPGVYYWRVVSTLRGADALTPSAVWPFVVRPGGARVDTFGGSLLDLNGDGLAELVLGAPGDSPGGRSGAGAVYIHRGLRSGGFESNASWTLAGVAAGDGLGRRVAPAGDVNGDGYADLLVLTREGPNGALRIFLGSAIGPDRTAARVLTGDPALGTLGAAVSAGDIDLDGRADLLLGFPNAGTMSAGEVRLYSGNPSSLTLTGYLSRWAGAEGGMHLGASLAGNCDFNGDGQLDLALGAPSATGPTGTGQAGLVLVQLGAAPMETPMGTVLRWSPATLRSPTTTTRFGHTLTAGLDLDGQGRSELVVAGDLGVALFEGTAAGLVPFRVPSLAENIPDRQQELVQALRDVNGDGTDELLLGLPDASPRGVGFAGTAHLYLGAQGVFAVPPDTTTPYVAFDGTFVDGHQGSAVAGLGDLNGDGFGDFAVGSFDATLGSLLSAGRVLVYLGGPSGPSPVPAGYVNGSSAGANIGFSVALAAPRRWLLPPG